MISYKKKVLCVDALFEGGRMFVGSVGVIYLLSLGFSASTVALLKIVQAITILVGEFPTGVISDYVGRKISLLAAIVTSSLGFLCFLDASQFFIIVVGEIFLALSLCLWSGAYEAWALEVAKIKDQEVKEFFHLNGSVNQFTVLATGMLGGLLAGQAGLYHLAYLAAFLVMGVLFFILLAAPAGDFKTIDLLSDDSEMPNLGLNSSHFHKITIEAKSSIKMVMQSPALVRLIGLLVVMQFAVQPVLHYWQPRIGSLYNNSGSILGLFFVLFCGGSAIISYVFKNKKVDSPYLLLGSWMGLIFLSGLFESKLFVSVTLIAAQISYFYLRSLVNSQVAINAPAAKRASVMSFSNLVSKLGMLVSLLAVSVTLAFFDKLELGVRVIYMVIPIFAVVLSFVGLQFYLSKKNNEVYRVSGNRI